MPLLFLHLLLSGWFRLSETSWKGKLQETLILRGCFHREVGTYNHFFPRYGRKIVRDFRWGKALFFSICDTAQEVGGGKVWRNIFLSRKQFWCSLCTKGNYIELHRICHNLASPFCGRNSYDLSQGTWGQWSTLPGGSLFSGLLPINSILKGENIEQFGPSASMFCGASKKGLFLLLVHIRKQFLAKNKMVDVEMGYQNIL